MDYSVLFGPGTSFVKDSFSQTASGKWFGDESSTLHLLQTLLLEQRTTTWSSQFMLRKKKNVRKNSTPSMGQTLKTRNIRELPQLDNENLQKPTVDMVDTDT